MNIDLSEINEQPKPELIQSNMMRIDDLELLYIYAHKLHLDIKNGLKVVSESKYVKFKALMAQLDEKLAPYMDSR